MRSLSYWKLHRRQSVVGLIESSSNLTSNKLFRHCQYCWRWNIIQRYCWRCRVLLLQHDSYSGCFTKRQANGIARSLAHATWLSSRLVLYFDAPSFLSHFMNDTFPLHKNWMNFSRISTGKSNRVFVCFKYKVKRCF